MEITTEKKRRGRKSKSELALINEQNPTSDNIIVTTEKLPKKRGRKRTKKQYFTSDTDAAIKEYLSSSNQPERDHIFKTRIHYPFYKLAENLIHTFKLPI